MDDRDWLDVLRDAWPFLLAALIALGAIVITFQSSLE